MNSGSPPIGVAVFTMGYDHRICIRIARHRFQVEGKSGALTTGVDINANRPNVGFVGIRFRIIRRTMTPRNHRCGTNATVASLLVYRSGDDRIRYI